MAQCDDTPPNDQPTGWRGRPMLTPQEVRQIVRLSSPGVYQALASGQIPGRVQIGRTVRVKTEVFAKWYDAAGVA